MSATYHQTTVRGSMLIVVSLLVLIASALMVSSPSMALADGEGNDTVQLGDTLGGSVGKSYDPVPPDPTVAPNEYLDEARELITELATVVRTIWI